MKKLQIFICIYLAIGCLLSACSKEGNRIDQNAAVRESRMESAMENSKTTDNLYNSKVKAQVQLNEGVYFDESVYQYVDIAESEPPLVYCEIKVSNVTDSSFDFTIYERSMATDENKVIFPASTAAFTGDGTEAVYYGEDQTLTFTFPGDQAWYPDIREMSVSGFEQLEGKSYIYALYNKRN